MAPKPLENRNVSKPIKRIRWATQRVTGLSAQSKRRGIKSRFQKGSSSSEKKRESGGSDSADGSHIGGSPEEEESGSNVEEETEQRRKIFFNIPLPDDAKDEEGHPLAHYGRNKVRTARYTPLSFIPKNLWYQFHNIANIYFAFLVILAVS
jgi:phospholipid-translocating ATPase